MSLNDWNAEIIADFRANQGRVAGPFRSVPVLLLHHVGRKSGREYVSPLIYQQRGDVLYVFGSYAGAPTNPDWYYNARATGEAVIELGTETYPVRVDEVTGTARDRIFAEQARRYPQFTDYENKTRGIRVIPVLSLTRIPAA